MTQTLQTRHALAQANRSRQLARFTPLADAAKLQLNTLLSHGASIVHVGVDQVVLERAGRRVTVDQHGRVDWGTAMSAVPKRHRHQGRSRSMRT